MLTTRVLWLASKMVHQPFKNKGESIILIDRSFWLLIHYERGFNLIDRILCIELWRTRVIAFLIFCCVALYWSMLRSILHKSRRSYTVSSQPDHLRDQTQKHDAWHLTDDCSRFCQIEFWWAEECRWWLMAMLVTRGVCNNLIVLYLGCLPSIKRVLQSQQSSFAVPSWVSVNTPI